MSEKRKGAGRPKKEVTREEAEKLCYLQCTRGEIAHFFEVSEDTIDSRCREWGFPNFQTFHKTYAEGGKISLRRYQYEAAKRGNSALLIWLGKQYLGQRDLKEVEHSLPEPVIIVDGERRIELGAVINAV